MNRIYHTWDKWECYPARFYENTPPGKMTDDECTETYRAMLSDLDLFRAALQGVTMQWVNSCEHYLSNPNMNRIAWLGQASLAWMYGIPSRYRGGYNLLTDDEKAAADGAALDALNAWLVARGEEPLTTETVQSRTQANLY